jgi:hypothetical protein
VLVLTRTQGEAIIKAASGMLLQLAATDARNQRTEAFTAAVVDLMSAGGSGKDGRVGPSDASNSNSSLLSGLAALIAGRGRLPPAAHQQQQQQQQPAVVDGGGYMCWQDLLEASRCKSGAAGAISTANSSSSSSRGGGGVESATTASQDRAASSSMDSSTCCSSSDELHDDLSGVRGRLGLLAATATVTWRLVLQNRRQEDPHSLRLLEPQGLREEQLLSVLLVLVRQLQAVPPQLRAEFLHSPSGGCLLRVLHGMSLDTEQYARIVETPSSRTPSGVPAARQQQQQEMSALEAFNSMYKTGRTLAEQLLLPGLLLQPASSSQDAPEHEGCSSSSSSGRCEDNQLSSSSSSNPRCDAPLSGVVPQAGQELSLFTSGGASLLLANKPTSSVMRMQGAMPWHTMPTCTMLSHAAGPTAQCPAAAANCPWLLHL